MHKHKKIGVLLILVGICFPLLMMAFATKIENITMLQAIAIQKGYPLQEDIVDKIQNLEIVLQKGQVSASERLENPIIAAEKERKMKISIPYRYVLAIGILCLFIGIGFLALGHKPNR